MKIGIMQPYFFPYLGYFQLISQVEKMVFYDDVNYINRGWINRNRILINKNASYLTVPLKRASQNKKINEVEFVDKLEQIKKTISFAYRKAPYFEGVWPVIESSLGVQSTKISELAISSVVKTCEYLNIPVVFERSSIDYPETSHLRAEERIWKIIENNNGTHYFNLPGGKKLYNRDKFLARGIKLSFVSGQGINYSQSGSVFVDGLSIIDVLMFNSPGTIAGFLKKVELS